MIKNDATTLLFHFFGTIMMQTTPSSPEEINITNGASVIGAEHFKITKRVEILAILNECPVLPKYFAACCQILAN